MGPSNQGRQNQASSGTKKPGTSLPRCEKTRHQSSFRRVRPVFWDVSSVLARCHGGASQKTGSTLRPQPSRRGWRINAPALAAHAAAKAETVSALARPATGPVPGSPEQTVFLRRPRRAARDHRAAGTAVGPHLLHRWNGGRQGGHDRRGQEPDARGSTATNRRRVRTTAGSSARATSTG
jgi:hypothetical protein